MAIDTESRDLSKPYIFSWRTAHGHRHASTARDTCTHVIQKNDADSEASSPIQGRDIEKILIAEE